MYNYHKLKIKCDYLNHEDYNAPLTSASVLNQMMSFRHALVALKTRDTFAAETLARLCVTALFPNAIRIAIASLATAIWILHRIAEETLSATFAQSSCIAGLTNAADLSIPYIASACKVAIRFWARTGLAAMSRIGITIESICALLTVCATTVVPTVLLN